MIMISSKMYLAIDTRRIIELQTDNIWSALFRQIIDAHLSS